MNAYTSAEQIKKYYQSYSITTKWYFQLQTSLRKLPISALCTCVYVWKSFSLVNNSEKMVKEEEKEKEKFGKVFFHERKLIESRR